VIAHKEERFLFPLYLLATSFPVLAFAPSGKAWPNWARRLWPYRSGGFAKAIAALSVATMALLAVYPPGFISHLPAAQYFYRNFPNGLTVYTFAPEPFRSFPMYRPVPYRSPRLTDKGALQDLLVKGPVYLLSETPTLPSNTLPPRARAQLLYSEWRLARTPAMAAFGTGVIQFDRWLNWKIFGLKISIEENQKATAKYDGVLAAAKEKEVLAEDELAESKRELARLSKVLTAAEKVTHTIKSYYLDFHVYLLSFHLIRPSLD